MYVFEIADIFLKEYFVDYQKTFETRFQDLGITYISTPECSLERLLYEIEYIPFDYYDDFDQLRCTVISYWFSHWEIIDRWRNCLKQVNRRPSQESLIVFRTVHLPTFRNRLEAMMQR
jgi:hypothetical protein